MTELKITPRQFGKAVVLTLPDRLATTHSAEVVEALHAADRTLAPGTRVVVDLRAASPLPAQLARALVSFARDRDCVLVAALDQATTAVLDEADPGAAVRRASSLGEALAEAAEVPPPFATGEAVRSLAFDSDDLGRTEAFLSSAYAPMRIGSDTGHAGTHLSRHAVSGLSADRLDLSFEMSYDVEPLGMICLCDVESGTIEDHRVDGWAEAETYGPGELVSFSPPDRPCTGRVARAKYSITLLDPVLLSQAAGVERPVRLLDHRPVDATAAQHLRSAVAHLRDDVLGVPGVGENPLAVATVARYLAVAVLNTFPHTASAEQPGDGLDAHSRTLRRAISFIEANLHRPLDIAEIAAVARVSARAVQLAFRRHLGTTPMAYLRRARLDRARAELRAAVPEQDSVARIAARWGYAPSVFAAHYRAAYGESPSATLHRDTVPEVRFPGSRSFVRTAVALKTEPGAAEPNARTAGRATATGGLVRPGDPGRAEPDAAGRFESLSKALLSATSVAEVLRLVVEATATAVAGADWVSVTVLDAGGRFSTAARTGKTAADLDRIQYRAGEGPCVEAARPDGPGYVASADLALETRWPRFAAAAREHGCRAAFSTELPAAPGLDRAAGALTVYSRRPEPLSETDRRIALLLATHASLALANTHLRKTAERRHAEFRRAVDSRDVIGQAKGILMNREGLTADEAFDLLRRTSQDLNVKLVELARTITRRHGELDQ
ncbi:ANTAR domain-containing protein [Amycolatopsis orientalis]|uniref:ANTAR domain-containing protein n=1 Tax=Amycolatopsis orientalis TaxID=31958 RepID=UPI00039E50AC|nr:ANTAR domain-containing protein [Amycolatopsis orientalis]